MHLNFDASSKVILALVFVSCPVSTVTNYGEVLRFFAAVIFMVHNFRFCEREMTGWGVSLLLIGDFIF